RARELVRRAALRSRRGARGMGDRPVRRSARARGARARRRRGTRLERRVLRSARGRSRDGRRLGVPARDRRGGAGEPARAAARRHRPAARLDGDLQGRRRRARSGLPSGGRGGVMSKEAVRTEAAPTPFQGAPYSQAIKAGGFVFVSGQLGLAPGAKEMVDGGVAAQTEQIFANLRAILEAAGSSLDNLVKTTVYLQHLDDFAAMNEVYRNHVGDTPPARATVEVARLPSGSLVEIEAIAVV